MVNYKLCKMDLLVFSLCSVKLEEKNMATERDQRLRIIYGFRNWRSHFLLCCLTHEETYLAIQSDEYIVKHKTYLGKFV